MRCVILHDNRPRSASISMLNGSNNEATTGKLSHILSILCSRAGHAVGEDHDRKSILLRQMEILESWSLYNNRGFVQWNIDERWNGGASDQTPQTESEEAVSEKVADARKSCISFTNNPKRLWNP